MYTPWCDDAGKQIDDGTVQRLEENRFRITSAEPNLEWLTHIASGMDVDISEDSEETASLALQGPNSRAILNDIVDKSDDFLVQNFSEMTSVNVLLETAIGIPQERVSEIYRMADRIIENSYFKGL